MLGSMLGQKNVFFDVENWKNEVPRGIAKKIRFWIDFWAKNLHVLKVREMQKCGFRLGGVQFLAKIVCRCWGFKNRALEGGFGRLFGVENGVQTGKMRSERPTEKWAVFKTVNKPRRKRRVTPSNFGCPGGSGHRNQCLMNSLLFKISKIQCIENTVSWEQ